KQREGEEHREQQRDVTQPGALSRPAASHHIPLLQGPRRNVHPAQTGGEALARGSTLGEASAGRREQSVSSGSVVLNQPQTACHRSD
ncbi:putative archaetidylserine decarboxylase proenzyme, partial [Clarias magur]